MKRTTISLPDDLALALEREARRRGQSVSAVTRDTLSERFGVARHSERLPFADVGGSGRSDTAARIQDLMADEWRADSDR